jgi:hypothetical protein
MQPDNYSQEIDHNDKTTIDGHQKTQRQFESYGYRKRQPGHRTWGELNVGMVQW